jgi:hypothetical protein
MAQKQTFFVEVSHCRYLDRRSIEQTPFRISEEFRYRHQLPFRYRTKSISDIPISKIGKSVPTDPNKILKNTVSHTDFEPSVFMSSIWRLTTALRGFTHFDVGYRLWDKSLFRNPT